MMWLDWDSHGIAAAVSAAECLWYKLTVRDVFVIAIAIAKVKVQRLCWNEGKQKNKHFPTPYYRYRYTKTP